MIQREGLGTRLEALKPVGVVQEKRLYCELAPSFARAFANIARGRPNEAKPKESPVLLTLLF